jgi:hypothetical protein
MKESFICRKFGKSTLAVIDQANLICDEYQARGFTLTLRQLFYQFVARGLMPNAAKEYKNLGAVVNNARLVDEHGEMFASNMTELRKRIQQAEAQKRCGRRQIIWREIEL